MARTKVILERSDFRGFPQCCASCLAVENLGHTRFKSKTFLFLSDRQELEVPICARCARRMTWLHRLRVAIWFVVPLLSFFTLDRLDMPKSWSAIISAGVTGLLESYLQDFRLGPVRVHKWPNRERLTFRFTNQDYARQFEALNPSISGSGPLIPVL